MKNSKLIITLLLSLGMTGGVVAQAKDAKPAKDVKDAKSAKEAKDAKSAKDAKPAKDAPAKEVPMKK